MSEAGGNRKAGILTGDKYKLEECHYFNINFACVWLVSQWPMLQGWKWR